MELFVRPRVFKLSFKLISSSCFIRVCRLFDSTVNRVCVCFCSFVYNSLNYNYTKDAAKLDYVADLESALKNTELLDETKEHIRHQKTTNLHNKRPVKLDNDEQKAIKDLLEIHACSNPSP